MERTRKSSIFFMAMVALALYVLISGALAISTVDKCGDESADKAWVLLPPHWKCGSDEQVLIVP